MYGLFRVQYKQATLFQIHVFGFLSQFVASIDRVT